MSGAAERGTGRGGAPRRIAAWIAKDIRVGGRDAITTYLLLGPLLLGLMVALVAPWLDESPLRLVVEQRVPEARVAAAGGFARIERVAGAAAVFERVAAPDDALGVGIDAAGEVAVFVQGDEPPEWIALATRLVAPDAAVQPPDAAALATVRGLGDITPIAAALVLFTVPVLVGLAIGLTIVDERRSEVSAALTVTPLRFHELIAAKLALGAAVSLALVGPTAALALAPTLGAARDWAGVALGVLGGTLCALPFALSLGIWLGALAKDELGAIGAMKLLLPVWTSVPVLAFVDFGTVGNLVLAPLGNVWATRALYAACTGAPWVSHGAIALLTGLPVLALAVLWLRRQLGYRDAAGQRP
jgi:hypothetical protein